MTKIVKPSLFNLAVVMTARGEDTAFLSILYCSTITNVYALPT